MTAAITVHDDEPEFAVDRDPQGEVTLTIHADGSTIRVNVGRLYASVSLLAQSLHRLAEDVDADILEAWYEVPEESDAYISFDHGRYHVSLEGVPVGDYPSQDVAELELARAMVCGGVFPPAWFIKDHGNCDDINENIRRWHDDAGDAMVPSRGCSTSPATGSPTPASTGRAS